MVIERSNYFNATTDIAKAVNALHQVRRGQQPDRGQDRPLASGCARQAATDRGIAGI